MMGGRVVHITVRVPAELLRGVDNVSSAVRDGLSLRQRANTSIRTAELRLRRTAWSDIDRIIESLAHRHVRPEDLHGPSGELSAPIKARIRAVLPPLQARRIELVLSGMYYEEIGVLDGCSKQAAEQAVKRGFASLAADSGFIAVLVRHFGSEVDPDRLLEALQHERTRPARRFARS